MALIEVRLRPTTPWRVGHRSGDRERVDVVFHSDALYSAVTHAMRSLGWMEEWLDATARAEGDPAVRFSSLFPFIGRTRLVTPPATHWPPANPGRLFAEGAKLVPLDVARRGLLDEQHWMVDGASECLVPTGSGAPFEIAVRTAAAVDRLNGTADPHRIACLEFAPHAGWWGVFAVEESTWESRVKSAFRLLADTGFGGERSRGWGRSETPEFSDASGLFPSTTENGDWWLLSLYSPHATDAVDWTRGEFSAQVRGGWVDSAVGSGSKKQVRMMEEGSVVFAPKLRGQAVNVAPDGFPHPVFRAGFAFAVAVPPPYPARVVAPEPQPEPETQPPPQPEEQPETQPEPDIPETEPTEADPETEIPQPKEDVEA